MSTRIVCHHIGARDGSVGGLLPARFADGVRYVLYDADEPSIDTARRATASTATRDAQWLPVCLAREDGEAEFFVNADPYTSSLLPPSRRFAAYTIAHAKGFDYVFGVAARPKETRRIPTRSLDSLVRTGQAPPPDFIALDTQGSELAIIEGGLQSIRATTVAIYTEVAFDEIYCGQPTFAALDTLLRREGFQLFDLWLDGWSPRRSPIGLRGETMPLFGDALYFRRLDRLPPATFAAHKLAFLAAAFGHLELMSEALDQADEICETSYGAFLESVRAAARKMESGFPRQWPEPRPRSSRIARSLRKRLGWIAARRRSSPVERVFEEWGFHEVAGKLMQRRLSDIWRAAD